MKKILLGLGVIATMASPVVLAVSCGNGGDHEDITTPEGIHNEHGVEILVDENKQVTSVKVTGTHYSNLDELMADVMSLVSENQLIIPEDKNIVELVTVSGNDALNTLVQNEVTELNKVPDIEIMLTQEQLNNVVTIDPTTGRVTLHEVPGEGYMIYLTDSLNSIIEDGEILNKKDIVTATVVPNDGYVLAHGSAHSATDSFVPHEPVAASDTPVTITQAQLDGIVTIDMTTLTVTINDPNIEGISLTIVDGNNHPVTNGQVLTESSTITITATAENGYVLAGGSAHSASDSITIINTYTLNASEQITSTHIQSTLDAIHSNSASNFRLTVQGRHSRDLAGAMSGSNGRDNNAVITINAADRAGITKDSLKGKILSTNGLDYVSKLEVEFAFGRTEKLTNDEIGKVYDWYCNDTWGWPKETFGVPGRQGGKPITLPTESSLLTEFMSRTGGGIVSANDPQGTDAKARLYFSFPKSFGTITNDQIAQITSSVNRDTNVPKGTGITSVGTRAGNTLYNSSFHFSIQNVPMGWYYGVQTTGISEHIVIVLETNLSTDTPSAMTIQGHGQFFTEGWWAHDVMEDGTRQSMFHVLPLGNIISTAH